MKQDSLFDLSGRRALVTGSSRGIGRAFALGLAKQGASVVVHASSQRAAADDVVAEIRTSGGTADVVMQNLAHDGAARKLASAATAAIGQIDILILNASYQASFEGLTPTEEFDLHTHVNLKAAMELVSEVLPNMQSNGWGRIVGIGSIQESKPLSHMLLYAATKAAQENALRNLARQCAATGVTVNNLAPGVILTDRNRVALSDEAYRNKILHQIPAHTFGEPEDCVGTALLLCSDAGRYITGSTIFVDGGMHL